MKRFLALSAAILVTFSPARAFVVSFEGPNLPTRWNLIAPQFTHPNVVNPLTRSIRYYIGPTHSVENRAAEVQAVRDSFAQWQAVSGTLLKFEEGGFMSGNVDINTADNTNVVYWAKSSTLVNNQFDNIRGATGVTFSDVFGDNSIAEGDIVMNGVDFAWFTDYNRPVSSAHFIESVLTHEIGHFIGLDHSPLGGATMFTRGASGLNVQAELSSDEISAARYLYGNSVLTAALARISGTVSLNSTGVYGAAVIVEDASGQTVAGTVTRTNGIYEVSALPAGDYQVRVTPLDPPSVDSMARLVTGADIQFRYKDAETRFLPTTNKPVSLAAGRMTALNFTLTPGTAPFRITRLRSPVPQQDFLIVVNSANGLTPGQKDMFVGIYSPNLPTANATLTITGDGLTVGPTLFKPEAFTGLNMISVQVSVATNATPGLRSLVLRQGENVVYANGFLRVLPLFPDINGDGFDDRFQRQYFLTPFATNAAPTLDPDRDGFNNFAEYTAGSNPTDASSVLRIESIRWDTSGATLRWKTAAGRRYQISSRASASPSDAWENVGDPVVAADEITEFLDPAGDSSTRLYRIVAVP